MEYQEHEYDYYEEENEEESEKSYQDDNSCENALLSRWGVAAFMQTRIG